MFAGLLFDCLKVGVCLNVVCLKIFVVEVLKVGLLNFELLIWGGVVVVLAMLFVCCLNRLGVVLVVICLNMGVVEGVVVVLLVSWLKVELELVVGG